MNVSKLALAFAASAAFVAAAPVFAAMPAQSAAQPATQQSQAWTPASNAANAKITRAQVRQELIQAQHDGELAALQQVYRGS
jgi:invasion protein IalB